jgi:hypothetical protein
MPPRWLSDAIGTAFVDLERADVHQFTSRARHEPPAVLLGGADTIAYQHPVELAIR